MFTRLLNILEKAVGSFLDALGGNRKSHTNASSNRAARTPPGRESMSHRGAKLYGSLSATNPSLQAHDGYGSFDKGDAYVSNLKFLENATREMSAVKRHVSPRKPAAESQLKLLELGLNSPKM